MAKGDGSDPLNRSVESVFAEAFEVPDKRTGRKTSGVITKTKVLQNGTR
jgi:hypothetical protein